MDSVSKARMCMLGTVTSQVTAQTPQMPSRRMYSRLVAKNTALMTPSTSATTRRKLYSTMTSEFSMDLQASPSIDLLLKLPKLI